MSAQDDGALAEARALIADLTSAAWWRRAAVNPLFRRALLLSALIIVFDQATKLWVLHGLDLDRTGPIDLSSVFDLTYVENRGVSFGLFAGGLASRILLSVLAVLVSVVVTHWLAGLRPERRAAMLAGGLLVGGALGNVIDRVAYGFVVDFLDFSGLGFPYVFNVADAAINVGVACLVWDHFVAYPKLTRTAGGEAVAPNDMTGSQDAARFATPPERSKRAEAGQERER